MLGTCTILSPHSKNSKTNDEDVNEYYDDNNNNNEFSVNIKCVFYIKCFSLPMSNNIRKAITVTGRGGP
jgi:hypothetical protein